MKQVIGARLSCNISSVLPHLQREVGAVPVITSSKVEIKVMYLFTECRLDHRMLYQELVQKRSPALLRPNYEKVGQRPHQCSAKPVSVPGSISLLGSLLHLLSNLQKPMLAGL